MSEPTTNPFDDPAGLHFELVDHVQSPVHKSTKGIRVNGTLISHWIEEGGVTIRTSSQGPTTVTVRFLAASVTTTSES